MAVVTVTREGPERSRLLAGIGSPSSSSGCATGHIKDPVPLIEERRGLSPGGRFLPGFIHR